VGQQALEIEFWKGYLQHIEEQRMFAGTDRETAIFQKVKEEVSAGGRLTCERMVKLARVSRSIYYRFDESANLGANVGKDVRDAIQRWPSNGPPIPHRCRQSC
jgi:hypothetical protein